MAPHADQDVITAGHQTDLASDLAALAHCFGRAAGIVGEHRTDLVVAGRPVTMRFAGPALYAVLAPAFAHLVTDTRHTDPALTILFWDSASTGVRAPSVSVIPSRGDVVVRPERHEGGLFSWLSLPERRVCIYDPGPSLAVYAASDAAAIEAWERACPARQIFDWWLATEGMQLIHGGAIGTDHGAMVVTGRGGSGKSTTCLAALASGMQYLADDYVIIEPGPDPRAHSLVCTGKLTHEQADRFTSLLPDEPATGSADPTTPKRAAFLARTHPDLLTPTLPLRAVALPRITGADSTRIVPGDRAEILKAMAPSTIFQLAGDGSTALATMTRVLDDVPSVELLLGHDPFEVAATIGHYLETGATQL